jgi:hypothetical protein
MTKHESTTTNSEKNLSPKQRREQRLAAELRANLQKRKVLAREKAAVERSE